MTNTASTPTPGTDLGKATAAAVEQATSRAKDVAEYLPPADTQIHCAYCDEVLDRAEMTRARLATVQAHAKTCLKHPMREVSAKVHRLEDDVRVYRELLQEVVGLWVREPGPSEEEMSALVDKVKDNLSARA